MPSTAAPTFGPDSTTLQTIAGPCSTPQQAALAPLLDTLTERYAAALVGIVYYGSCLRDGDPTQGLADFYVVVDHYRRAHAGTAAALFNALLPPNVYYLERTTEQGVTLRCKYAVISEGDLHAGITRGFLSGLWGRFAQPMAIVHAATVEARARLRALCGQAVISLLEQTLPALTGPDSAASAYARALALSYGAEMRVEADDRGRTVVTHQTGEYARRLRAAAPYLSVAVNNCPDGRIDWRPAAGLRRRALVRWPVRRAAGRVHSVARLAKACFTFSNAVDYGAWKLERHTGVHIEVTPRLRRHPLIYAWPVLWQLYRQGTLR